MREGEKVLELRGTRVSAGLLELHLHCRERVFFFKKRKEKKNKGRRGEGLQPGPARPARSCKPSPVP